MHPQEYETAKALFFEALSLPPMDAVRRFRARYSIEEIEASAELQRMSQALELRQSEATADLPVAVAAVDRFVGRYRIEREVGFGGMGRVFLGHSPEGEAVAVKQIHAHLLTKEIQARFEREAQILAQLDHPGIVRFLDYVPGSRAGEIPSLVTEFVAGQPLTAAVAEAALGREDRARIVAEVCEAVGAAHASGIVHRDLKPGNILVDGEGRARVLDFGIARVLEAEAFALTELTRTSDFMGTLQYMSPEQARLDAEVGPSSDVYTLGVLLYEVLTGLLPYEEGRTESLPRMILAISNDEPRPLGTAVPGVDRALSAIVMRALEKNPKHRYADASEMAADLDAYLQGRPLRVRRRLLMGRLRRGLRWVRRRPVGSVIGASVVVAVVAVGMMSAVRVSDADRLQHALASIDRANALLHHSTHTEAGLVEATELLLDSNAALQELESDSFTGHLRRFVYWRLGEARFFLAGVRQDLREVDSAIMYWSEASELPFYPEIGTRLDPEIGFYDNIREDSRLVPRSGIALGLSIKSNYDRPAEHLSMAQDHREVILNALREGHPQGPIYTTHAPPGVREKDIDIAAHSLATTLVDRTALTDSVKYAERAIALLRPVDAERRVRVDGGWRGVFHHVYGEAHLERGRLLRSSADLDSAETQFLRARQLRPADAVPAGYLASTCGRVRVRQERARLWAESRPMGGSVVAGEPARLLADGIRLLGEARESMVEKRSSTLCRSYVLEVNLQLDRLALGAGVGVIDSSETLDVVGALLDHAENAAPESPGVMLASDLALARGRWLQMQAVLSNQASNLDDALLHLRRGQDMIAESEDSPRYARYQRLIDTVVAISGGVTSSPG